MGLMSLHVLRSVRVSRLLRRPAPCSTPGARAISFLPESIADLTLAAYEHGLPFQPSILLQLRAVHNDVTKSAATALMRSGSPRMAFILAIGFLAFLNLRSRWLPRPGRIDRSIFRSPPVWLLSSSTLAARPFVDNAHGDPILPPIRSWCKRPPHHRKTSSVASMGVPVTPHIGGVGQGVVKVFGKAVGAYHALVLSRAPSGRDSPGCGGPRRKCR